ncbi:protein NDR1 [Cajanus cajan]|uniref:Protein NDR1 n=1 Tax=Cajanus cajan TaxID=3821 RepID=A0A151RX21_CAJCA|nr:protein NDR1 [Cajanus cajan]KYP47099.1 hypothetical protein KK1_031256 [Cajanus cajan]
MAAATSSDSCCTRCLSFLITTGMAALFIWLSLRVDEPRLYLKQIYVPSLNKTLNPKPHNNTVFFTLHLVNNNKDKGIQYDDVLLSFARFASPNATRPLGNATVAGFYQGHGKKAKKRASLAAAGNLTAPVDGRVFYRVDFTTAVKYKILFWYSKRHRLWGGANVEIDARSGEKVHRKDVRLGGKSPPVIPSGAPGTPPGYRALPCVVALFLLAQLT